MAATPSSRNPHRRPLPLGGPGWPGRNESPLVPRGHGQAHLATRDSPWNQKELKKARRKERELEVWIERVRVILDRAPTRAMPLSHLLQSLEGVGGNRKEIGDWILKTMKGKEESFRVIPDRLGPWVWRMSPGGSSASIPAMARQDPDPWVLIRSPASRSSEPEERVFGQIRECLGAWGEAVDTGSQTSVACWIGANREAERALARLATPERIPA